LTVAALYVQKDGAYYGLPDVDPWDEERDARNYSGPWPVVAHPPCARWSRLAGFTEAVFGLRRGDDGGCFAAALDAVRRFGGVLEHPAYSDAWEHFGLPRPNRYGGWTASLFDPGWSCYVEQGRYGLPAKKATWLYACGVDLPDLRWGFVPDSAGKNPRDSNERGISGGLHAWRDSWRTDVHRVVHKGVSSATPPEFRDALLRMARSALPSLAILPRPSGCSVRARPGLTALHRGRVLPRLGAAYQS